MWGRAVKSPHRGHRRPRDSPVPPSSPPQLQDEGLAEVKPLLKAREVGLERLVLHAGLMWPLSCSSLKQPSRKAEPTPTPQAEIQNVSKSGNTANSVTTCTRESRLASRDRPESLPHAGRALASRGFQSSRSPGNTVAAQHTSAACDETRPVSCAAATQSAFPEGVSSRHGYGVILRSQTRIQFRRPGGAG